MTRCVGQGIDHRASNLLSTAKAGTNERMGRSKRTPERSRLVRAGDPPAPSRRQRPDGGEDDDAKHAAKDVENAKDTKEGGVPTAEPTALTQTDLKALDDESASAADTPTRPDPKDLPAIDPPDPKAEPWPDATPPPMRPVEPPNDAGRLRTETLAGNASPFGRPPDMPGKENLPPLVLGDVENPAHMPGPLEIPGGNPDDPAPVPGQVPPGDSRSLRRDNEFALIYRVGTCVITRSGRIGTRGQWRVVDYPTSTFASNSYAKECSRFVSEGFSDYRE